MSPGQYAEALRICRELLAQGAETPELTLCEGRALRALGRLEEALAVYRAAIVAHPGSGEAYWRLAELGLHRFSHEEITRMAAQEASPHSTQRDRHYLCFALAAALEERGQHELARRYQERGTRLWRCEGRDGQRLS